MTTRISWLILFGALLSACGGGDGGSTGNGDVDAKVQADVAPDAVVPDTSTPDNDGPDDTGLDTPGTLDTAVEAETHATPVAPALTSAHAGWENPKCLTCHEYDAHNDGSDPYLCAGCHGTNGAPKGHKTGGCDCHAGEHGDVGFPSPLSCTTCHPK